RGWIAYYGRYSPSALYPLFRYVNMTLLAWVQRKFKRYKGHKVRAAYLLSGSRLAVPSCVWARGATRSATGENFEKLNAEHIHFAQFDRPGCEPSNTERPAAPVGTTRRER